MKYLYLLCFLIPSLLIPLASCHKSSEENMTLNVTSGTLKGTLALPSSKKPYPVVLIIGGSGPIDRNGNNPNAKPNYLKQISDNLQNSGIAVLRYDKRGIGESNNFKIEESKLRFEDYINDAISWVEKLKKDKRFSEFYVLGHSEGSLIGIEVADKTKLDGLILVSSPASSLDKIIIKQLEPYKNSEIYNKAVDIILNLKKGEYTNDVPIPLLPLMRADVQGYLMSEFKYDPEIEIKKLNTRIIIIHGTADNQISEDNADILHNSSKNSKKVTIIGMNHVLRTTFSDQDKQISSYNNDSLPLGDKLISNIVNFIKNK